MDLSLSQRDPDAVSASSFAAPLPIADQSGRPDFDQSDRPSFDQSVSSSPSPPRPLDAQTQLSLRSEEYRQLFRLPPDEVLIQDFNCALQESFILQGHMYLFTQFICFYSNLFGFETKKIIPFNEITLVRRAKTAGIFPTAIEIVAGTKKFFFTSFLSRDEAFKIINDGWLLNSNEAKDIMDQQDLKSDLSNLEENEVLTPTGTKSFKHPEEQLDSVERSMEIAARESLNNREAEVASTSIRVLDNAREVTDKVLNTDYSSVQRDSLWELEDSDAPKVPESYTIVAESKFPITVGGFFNFFFSDDAVGFLALFRKKCGDREFRSSSWYPVENFWHARDISFQHPIKLYLGAKFGSCQEVQKYRIYRHGHLVVETSQEINGVPYGDYFLVEGFWHVQSDVDKSNECSILRVYINVAFSKKTMWKGKIVQSTIEECREAYAIWIDLAHELLKQKKIEKEVAQLAGLIPNVEVHLEDQRINDEPLGSSVNESDLRLHGVRDTHEQLNGTVLGRLSNVATYGSLFKGSMEKLSVSLKSHVHISLLLIIIIAVIIILMQVSIVVQLGRPQQVYVISQADRSNNLGIMTKTLLEKGINHLKDEMDMIEALLEKMRQEHAILKMQLSKLEQLQKQQF